MAKRFVILSGPSCVGKGSLQRTVARFFPEKISARPILCTSRPARAREVHGRDYYFLSAPFIQSLASSPDFAVSPVRSDWQAVHLVQVEQLLNAHNLVFAEVFHTFGQVLRAKAAAKGVAVSSVFLIPAELGTSAEEITSIMRRKLDLRGTDDDGKKNERSKEAPAEITNASHYTHVLLNTAGEDDVEEWGEFGTRSGAPGTKAVNSLDDLGATARWLVETFVGILEGRVPEGVHRPPAVRSDSV